MVETIQVKIKGKKIRPFLWGRTKNQNRRIRLVPGAGLEPAWAFEGPQDFKSCASANFATRAGKTMKNEELKT